jgi:modulator of FtsH protease HflC
MPTTKIIWGVVLAIFVMLALKSCVFVVSETEQALIIQLGDPVKIIAGDRGGSDIREIENELREYLKAEQKEKTVKLSVGAGLYFKMPFMQDVVFFEDRILEYESSPTDIVTKDKKHLLVDNFARWRITNPLLFYQRSQTESRAASRLDDIIYSSLREELAKNDLVEIVRTTNTPLESVDEKDRVQILTGREKIMNAVSEKCRLKGLEYGIEIVEVRIRRADLPEENQAAVFGRMMAERDRISKQYRSEGNESAQKIRSETDRDVQVVLAEAYKQSEILRGKADAKATKIYATAYKNYADFYTFTKSLETLENSMKKKSKVVLGTNSGLFKALKGK